MNGKVEQPLLKKGSRVFDWCSCSCKFTSTSFVLQNCGRSLQVYHHQDSESALRILTAYEKICTRKGLHYRLFWLNSKQKKRSCKLSEIFWWRVFRGRVESTINCTIFEELQMNNALYLACGVGGCFIWFFALINC